MKSAPNLDTFKEHMQDCIATDIHAVGIKKMASILYPKLAPATALAKLTAQLNPNQKHRFYADEMLLIKRYAAEVGSYATINHEGQLLGFRAQWVTPDERRADLQRNFIAAAEEMRAMSKELVALGESPLLLGPQR